jgi:hypothetical protein
MVSGVLTHCFFRAPRCATSRRLRELQVRRLCAAGMMRIEQLACLPEPVKVPDV